MSQADFWYIRFPDGRILRAASTAIVRQEVGAGHIPIASTVRRSPSDEWVSLQWTQEFADLAEQRPTPAAARETEPVRRRAGIPSGTPDHPATVGSRLDPSRLHLIGVRDCFDELLAALDSALIAKKILVGVLAGLILGSLHALGETGWFAHDSRLLVPAWCLTGAAIIVLTFLAALLTQWTYIELSRLRPARWGEGLTGIGPLTIRLLLAQAIVLGAAFGLIVLLRWLPYWAGPGPEELWSLGNEIAAGTALALGMVLEVALWSVFFLWWLLPPVLVVEECSIVRGLGQWLALLRHHLGRALLYQAMAVALGLLIAMPFLLLIAPVFLPSFSLPEELHGVAGMMRCILLGLACAPILTYWIVANVFIYLNLRYGASSRR